MHNVRDGHKAAVIARYFPTIGYWRPKCAYMAGARSSVIDKLYR